jgi:hypothetical protein
MDSETRMALSDCVYCLKHEQYVERVVLIQLSGLLPAIPDWKIKQAMALHLWQDSIHGRDIRARIKELRHGRPDKELAAETVFFRKALDTAPTPRVMLDGIYTSLKPRLISYYEGQADKLFAVNDAPTLSVLHKIIDEEKEQCRTMERLLANSIEFTGDNGEGDRWLQAFDAAVDSVLRDIFSRPAARSDQAQLLDRLAELGTSAPQLPVAQCARPQAFTISDTFTPPQNPAHRDEVIWHFTNYVQEMQAAETIGTTAYELPDMPWEFYADLARHLWDEVRHSTMGEVRLRELGIQLEEIQHMTGNYAWRQTVDPVRRYAALTLVIEANAFGLKNERLKAMAAADDFISAQAVLYDITDETTHVQYGQRWTPELIKHMGWTMTVDELVEECMEINARKTLNPTQRFQKKKSAG